MLKFLQQIDVWLLLKINGEHTLLLDNVMWFISGRLIWILIGALIFYLFWQQDRKNSLYLLFMALIAIGLADLTSVHLFKFTIQRLRPCHNPELQSLIHLVRNHCGGKYGFISSHASNSAALAVFSVLYIRKRWFGILIFLWAFLIGFSRVYLGVHYPFDVICGWIWGMLIGYFIWRISLLKFKNEQPQAIQTKISSE